MILSLISKYYYSCSEKKNITYEMNHPCNHVTDHQSHRYLTAVMMIMIGEPEINLSFKIKNS